MVVFKGISRSLQAAPGTSWGKCGKYFQTSPALGHHQPFLLSLHALNMTGQFFELSKVAHCLHAPCKIGFQSIAQQMRNRRRPRIYTLWNNWYGGSSSAGTARWWSNARITNFLWWLVFYQFGLVMHAAVKINAYLTCVCLTHVLVHN